MLTNTHNIETLYKKFSQRLRQFILKRVPEETVADDILQDVFLKIHSRIDTLKNKDKLESWIFQITRNVIADHYRNQRTTLEPHEDILVVQDEEDMTQKLAPCVAEVIDRLPEHYREAIRLFEYEGYTLKEVAQQLGISLSGAKSRVQRARSMLRDLLMQCCHFELDRYGTIIDYHPISCFCCNPAQSHQ